MLKTLWVQPVEIGKLGYEKVVLPHVQHHSMQSESISVQSLLLALSPI